MTPAMRKIQQYFMRFSYASKTKFVYQFSQVPIVLAFSMLYIFFYKPINNVEKQLRGIEYITEFTSLYRDMALYLDEKNTESTTTLPFDSIVKWQEKTNHWTNEFKKTQSKINLQNDFKEDQKVFFELWAKLAAIESSPSPLSLKERFIFTYYRLLFEIAAIFDIDLVQPAVLRNIEYIIIHDIPLVQISTIEGNNNPFSESLLSLQKNIETTLGRMGNNYATPDLQELKNKLKTPLNKDDLFYLNEKLIHLLIQGLHFELNNMNRILWLSLISILIGELSVGLIYFTRVLRNPLTEIVKAAKKLAKSDLSVRIPITTHDEVAELTKAFNGLAEYHEKILKKATDIIFNIFEASSKITEMAKVMESNMNTQENMINQIFSYSKAIQKDVRDYNDVLDTIDKDSTGIKNMIKHGHVHLEGMDNVMHVISNALTGLVKTLSSLQEKMGDINKVISTIIMIADESNLLSLNTAIRANKAGSEGRGFLVIADKIGEMADQVAIGTLNVEQAVEKTFLAVREAVQDVDSFSNLILGKFEETHSIRTQLKQIMDSTEQQMQDFNKINQGLQSRTRQEIEINSAIKDLEQSIREAAFSIHRLYLEIVILHDASQNLHEKTSKFIFSS